MPRVGHTIQVNAMPSPVLASLFKDGEPGEDGMDTEDFKVDDRKRLVDLVSTSRNKLIVNLYATMNTIRSISISQECANMKALSGERIYDDKAPQMKCTPPVVQTDVYSGEDWNQNYEERKAQTARVVEEFNQSMRGAHLNCFLYLAAPLGLRSFAFHNKQIAAAFVIASGQDVK